MEVSHEVSCKEVEEVDISCEVVDKLCEEVEVSYEGGSIVQGGGIR